MRSSCRVCTTASAPGSTSWRCSRSACASRAALPKITRLATNRWRTAASGSATVESTSGRRGLATGRRGATALIVGRWFAAAANHRQADRHEQTTTSTSNHAALRATAGNRSPRPRCSRGRSSCHVPSSDGDPGPASGSTLRVALTPTIHWLPNRLLRAGTPAAVANVTAHPRGESGRCNGPGVRLALGRSQRVGRCERRTLTARRAARSGRGVGHMLVSACSGCRCRCKNAQPECNAKVVAVSRLGAMLNLLEIQATGRRPAGVQMPSGSEHPKPMTDAGPVGDATSSRPRAMEPRNRTRPRFFP